MSPLAWTKLATEDDLGDLEVRLRAHTELTVAQSTRTMVAASIGAAMANFGLVLAALNLG